MVKILQNLKVVEAIFNFTAKIPEIVRQIVKIYTYKEVFKKISHVILTVAKRIEYS